MVGGDAGMVTACGMSAYDPRRTTAVVLRAPGVPPHEVAAAIRLGADEARELVLAALPSSNLFATRFRTPLGDQFSNRIAAFCCLSEPTPKTFERSQASFQQQPIVLDASNEGVALAEAELFALLRVELLSCFYRSQGPNLAR